MFGFFRVIRNLFNTTLRRHHAQNVALKLDLCSLVCVNYPFVLFSFRFMHTHCIIHVGVLIHPFFR